MAVEQFELTQDFPVGLERLWISLGRADYVEQKYRSLGSTSLRLLKFSADSESIEVELDRHAPVDQDDLPAWARVFSVHQQAVSHHTRWRRAGPGRVDVEVYIRAPALHVGAKGVGAVVELNPRHSCMTLQFEVASASRVALSTVGRVFMRQLKRGLEADHAFTLAYLRANSRRLERS